MSQINRRMLISGASATAAFGLAGCVGSQTPDIQAAAVAPPPPPSPSTPVSAAASGGSQPDYSVAYGPMPGEKFPLPAVKLSEIDPAFLRKQVDYQTKEPPGTIVIDTAQHYLYHVEDGGKATRYGVGVGREGFIWTGEATIKKKQEWPDWYPPKEMLERRPELRKQMAQLQSGTGMAGGLGNPIGARGMYLWQGDVDTYFRIHGTNEPSSIGKSVSSGCIRMINQDVIDLYSKTPPGTRVIVQGTAPVLQAKLARS
ncbi:L,D-transpeptidase [Methylocapsa palsarum]|uniref:Lipoprotein-anchoring transpeptidase ErfK/SrfK n=1 Tax=Methylocapsa palsarum TaxID=1612308 RepID=A0A1I4BE27_9HYPH|nr:L,D-transpeptidase [Methylocapsa palsarum]SFK67035.1 Lipoprotein-anchoring transpeptidase ErfK/SrfK [Methylocapsa palsarum]